MLAAVDRNERVRVAGVGKTDRRRHRVGDHELVRRLRAGVAIIEHENEPVAGNDDFRFFEQYPLLALGIGRYAFDEHGIVERNLVRGERLAGCEHGEQKEKGGAHTHLHQSILVWKVTVRVWPPATVPSATLTRVPL
ncbi:hypothetical protein [Sphingopyxis sp. 22461]|uniref:hypothetical protein n=1 Tax=Sphingopyxis sp. 22461 TaxID=3453923 RepID=UPI003F8249F8